MKHQKYAVLLITAAIIVGTFSQGVWADNGNNNNRDNRESKQVTSIGERIRALFNVPAKTDEKQNKQEVKDQEEQQNRDKKEAKQVEKRKEEIQKFWDKMVHRLQILIRNEKNLADRIQKRLDALISQGADVIDAKAKLAIARTKIADAEKALANASAQVSSIISSNDAKIAFSKVKDLNNQVLAKIKEAQRALVDAINATSAIKPSPSSTPTPTPTGTPTPTPSPVVVTYTAPQLGTHDDLSPSRFTNLNPGASADYGIKAQYTGPLISEDVFQWRIVIHGPAALTANQVKLVELGYLSNGTLTNNSSDPEVYTFKGLGGGTLFAQGSCKVSACLPGAFGLDQNDLFENYDMITFNSDAPLGRYQIDRTLMRTLGTQGVSSDDIPYSNVFTQVVNLVALPVTRPNAPSGLTATAIEAPYEQIINYIRPSPSNVLLKWIDNATNEKGFKIERLKDNEQSFHEIATVGTDVTTYTDNGLTTGTYLYRVRAFNTAGNSSYSNVASVTIVTTLPLTSGIRGRVIIGLICPVMTLNYDCDSAYATTMVVFQNDQKVGLFTSANDGTFSLSLLPGNYVIKKGSNESLWPMFTPVAVTVQSNQFTDLVLRFDNGIR